MSEVVKQEESIEGSKVGGHSRKPLAFHGPAVLNDIACFQYIARFDVQSSILETLSKVVTKMRSSARVELDDEVICARALVSSVKAKYASHLEAHVSGKHPATVWSFPCQTNVFILLSHQEILDGIAKRVLGQSGPRKAVSI
jgi:hypothetical protein